MNQLFLKSPAKLNLFLKVVNKRADGYHNLVTLFERIDLCDDIFLKKNPQGAIRVFCNHPQVPTGPKNLVFKVARYLKDKYNISKGVDIKITKRIPVAAGLAGGSSNGATVLLGLNKFWKLNLSQKELVICAKTIGSDVPFFLYDCSWALGTRRGDKIKQVPIPFKYWHVLVVPKRKIYTKEVYGRLNLELTKFSDDVNILIQVLKKNNINRVKELLVNDLESSILKICPSLLKVKQRLQAINPWGSGFSGSGPSVFGITKSKHQAQALQRVLAKRFSQVFVVRTF